MNIDQRTRSIAVAALTTALEEAAGDNPDHDNAQQHYVTYTDARYALSALDPTNPVLSIYPEVLTPPTEDAS